MHTYDIQKFLLRGTLWLTGGSTSNTDGIKSESGKKGDRNPGQGDNPIFCCCLLVRFFLAEWKTIRKVGRCGKTVPPG